MPNQIENKLENETKPVEYIVIGAGPAALCAIANILNSGVPGDRIVWVDPQFKVGDFGTKLSIGSSVPGNTSVENYQRVYEAIYKMVPACAPRDKTFEIDSLQANFVCSLKVAAAPMQHITNQLRKIVHSIEGTAINIFTMAEGLKVKIESHDKKSRYVTTKRVLLAIGAQLRTMRLPATHHETTMIDPNVVFIETELAKYLRKNLHIKAVAVIGSSHSAALATMHLLKAGLTVRQFMDKEYKYATPCVAANGTKYTMYDNTGLKGDVAKFTKQLLDDCAAGRGEYQKNLTLYIGKNRQDVNVLLERYLGGFSHAVAAIGYQPSNTLHINNIPLSRFRHNNKTTEFCGIKGLFGIGVAIPQEVTAISGEVESAVGVGKFWSTANNPLILNIWKENHAHRQEISQFFTQERYKHRAKPTVLRMQPACVPTLRSRL